MKIFPVIIYLQCLWVRLRSSILDENKREQKQLEFRHKMHQTIASIFVFLNTSYLDFQESGPKLKVQRTQNATKRRSEVCHIFSRHLKKLCKKKQLRRWQRGKPTPTHDCGNARLSRPMTSPERTRRITSAKSRAAWENCARQRVPALMLAWDISLKFSPGKRKNNPLTQPQNVWENFRKIRWKLELIYLTPYAHNLI